MEDIGIKPLESADVLHVPLESWTRNRVVSSLGTNAGSEKLPFQGWHHFKEAFAPEIVARAAKDSKRDILRCADPFGGSGTTALACQFLGIEPVTSEINPYLADLIEAKLCSYDADRLVRSLSRIVRVAQRGESSLKQFSSLPPTFIEARNKNRWIFDKPIAQRIAAYLNAIDTLPDPTHRRFFRVQLGGMLIQVSNVVINGKGRRYRQGWDSRFVSVDEFDALFSDRSRKAIVEAHEYRFRKERNYTLIRGDSRKTVNEFGPIDGAVFSPPYPNSFDYTDVYNVELWMLGYLSHAEGNRTLRESTLCSHVQIKRTYPIAPNESELLNKTLKKLEKVRKDLWSPWIPEMVGGYFHDMKVILDGLHARLSAEGETWAVIGDSQYADIPVLTGMILEELAPSMGYRVITVEPFRSMRVSAQQGGQKELDESLIVLRKQGPRKR
ncbi:hypothetical protein SAMN05444156_3107 [Verrucomicrobium sp. GAS474]|uniref:hypothetical protein n=1 Tax=Verrucomicrobium sp. GAS474 TaxID=1882831 RepID=UPI00087B1356|nr:hypothetical protein [Verrucomicrobium sp. GAS474]SDU29176.1 hypothetical protein SAMN05444156_3107 [Verrucomicrobium sp. GAS474]